MLTPRQIAKIRASVLRSLKAEVERQAESVNSWQKDFGPAMVVYRVMT